MNEPANNSDDHIEPVWPPAVDVWGPGDPPVAKRKAAPADDRLPTPFVRSVMLIGSLIAGFAINPAVSMVFFLVFPTAFFSSHLFSSVAAFGIIYSVGVTGLNLIALGCVVWFRKLLKVDLVGFGFGLTLSLMLFKHLL